MDIEVFLLIVLKMFKKNVSMFKNEYLKSQVPMQFDTAEHFTSLFPLRGYVVHLIIAV